MAIKDWKKTGKDEWSAKGIAIFIDKHKIYGHNDYVVVVSSKSGRNDLEKRFKTKSQALAYAKSYMRKH